MPTSKYKGSEIDSLLDAAQTKIGEAPKDSTSYARQNNAWVRINQSLLATVVGPRQMSAQNGSGEQAYTFSFDQPAASITLKSLSISGPGVSLKAGYSKSGFTVVATNIVGDVTAIVTAVFTLLGSDYNFDFTIFVSYQKIVDANGIGFVDFGLPSGTLWSTCNLGSNTVHGYGKYYMFGELTGTTSSNGTFDDGRFFDPTTESRYNGLLDADIDLTHDAAHALLGGDWHIPSVYQYKELLNNTTRSVEYVNNVLGHKFTGKNDPSKWIFFPFAGEGYGYDLYSSGTSGSYWTSTNIAASRSGFIASLEYQNAEVRLTGMSSWHGATIRAVI